MYEQCFTNHRLPHNVRYLFLLSPNVTQHSHDDYYYQYFDIYLSVLMQHDTYAAGTDKKN